MVRRWAALPALAATLAATGCGVAVDPVDVPPGSGASTAASGPGKLVGKYTDVEGECPTLDLPVAGKPGEVNNDTPLARIVTCVWGSGAGAVNLLLTIDRSTGTPTAEERTATAFEEEWEKAQIVHSKPESGIGDQAYLGVHRDRVNLVLAFRSSNAQATVTYQLAEELEPSGYDAALTENRDRLRGLAEDVLAGLR